MASGIPAFVTSPPLASIKKEPESEPTYSSNPHSSSTRPMSGPRDHLPFQSPAQSEPIIVPPQPPGDSLSLLQAVSVENLARIFNLNHNPAPNFPLPNGMLGPHTNGTNFGVAQNYMQMQFNPALGQVASFPQVDSRTSTPEELPADEGRRAPADDTGELLRRLLALTQSSSEGQGRVEEDGGLEAHSTPETGNQARVIDAETGAGIHAGGGKASSRALEADARKGDAVKHAPTGRRELSRDTELQNGWGEVRAVDDDKQSGRRANNHQMPPIPNLSLEIQLEIMKRIDVERAELNAEVGLYEGKLRTANNTCDKLWGEVQQITAMLNAKKEEWEAEVGEKHKIEGMLRLLTKQLLANEDGMKAGRKKLEEFKRPEGMANGTSDGGHTRSSFGEEGRKASTWSDTTLSSKYGDDEASRRRLSQASGSDVDYKHHPGRRMEMEVDRSADRRRSWQGRDDRDLPLKRPAPDGPEDRYRAGPSGGPPPFSRFPGPQPPPASRNIPLRGLCLDYNRDGVCPKERRCPLRHTCIICSGYHPYIECTAKRQICFKWNQGDTDGCAPTADLLCQREHRCLRCGAWGHRIIRCNVVPPPGGRGTEVCLAWNSDLRACSTAQCHRLHRCVRCKGEHKVLLCPENVGQYYEEFLNGTGGGAVPGTGVGAAGVGPPPRMMGPPGGSGGRGMSMPPPPMFGSLRGRGFMDGRSERGGKLKGTGFHGPKRAKIE
ncbi:hypothetical protein HDV00_012175 [Rhizophlyctis rosea]|nr:hypothetical protein HDV00_012175 [Rhizophlyctis rosea]